MKKIYQYTNYRLFINEYFHHKKNTTRNFSHRSFSEKAGFTSPNFIKLVIDKKKNLGKESVPKLCKAMELKKGETEYFSYLVFYNQAKTSIDKNYYFGLLATIKTPKNVERLNFKTFEYFNNWYNSIVREVINGIEVDKLDNKAVAQKLQPEITASQAKKSIALLIDLGFIKVENGVYTQSSPLLETEWENQSLAIRNYHKKMTELAGDSLESTPVDKRNISAITSKISNEGYTKIIKRISEFREELMQIIAEDKNVDQVYQMNFQLFPVSTKGNL